jgi:hypothetical protein
MVGPNADQLAIYGQFDRFRVISPKRSTRASSSSFVIEHQAAGVTSRNMLGAQKKGAMRCAWRDRNDSKLQI